MHFVDVCCLQESKLELISLAIWREIGGSLLNQFTYVPLRGCAEGIIMAWNSVLLYGKLERVGEFNLMVEFCSRKNNFKWRCTMVYVPNTRSLQHAFWEELRDGCEVSNLPWIICGDFNVIFNFEDQISGPPNLEDIHNANSFLHDMGLHEPPSVGRRFTWTNGKLTQSGLSWTVSWRIMRGRPIFLN